MEITINYSDEQFYSEELETLILRVLSKGAELQNVRNAIGSAVTAGYTSFQGIAVVGSDKGFTMPCGICRQVIAEFHIPVVIVAKDKDHYKIFDGSKLLPHAFEEGCLRTGERNG